MKCTKCGREIPDNVRFCKYCGNTTDSSHVAKQNADIGNQRPRAEQSRPSVSNQTPPAKHRLRGVGKQEMLS